MEMVGFTRVKRGVLRFPRQHFLTWVIQWIRCKKRTNLFLSKLRLCPRWNRTLLVTAVILALLSLFDGVAFHCTKTFECEYVTISVMKENLQMNFIWLVWYNVVALPHQLHVFELFTWTHYLTKKVKAFSKFRCTFTGMVSFYTQSPLTDFREFFANSSFPYRSRLKKWEIAFHLTTAMSYA